MSELSHDLPPGTIEWIEQVGEGRVTHLHQADGKTTRTETPARTPRSMVGPPGLEPETVGLKVRCSTN